MDSVVCIGGKPNSIQQSGECAAGKGEDLSSADADTASEALTAQAPAVLHSDSRGGDDNVPSTWTMMM